MRFSNAMLGADPRDYVGRRGGGRGGGFDSVALSDHVFLPEQLESKYPYTPDGKPQFSSDEQWPDPWVAVGALAQATTHLRFLTNVYILPLRNPLRRGQGGRHGRVPLGRPRDRSASAPGGCARSSSRWSSASTSVARAWRR